jgi:hypothetical protein
MNLQEGRALVKPAADPLGYRIHCSWIYRIHCTHSREDASARRKFEGFFGFIEWT